MKINIPDNGKVAFKDVSYGETFLDKNKILCVRIGSTEAKGGFIFNCFDLKNSTVSFRKDDDQVTIVQCEVNVRFP